jgi:pimeloyl-ACP methyl ester carboxylesterase
VKKPVMAALILLCIFAAGSMAAIHLLFSIVYFGRTGPRENPPESEEYRTLQFPSGKNMLQGYVYGGANTKGLVVVSHGIGSSAGGFIRECRWFARRGYRVFVYDCTGAGASEGKGTNGAAQSAIDLDAALTYIEADESFRGLPLLLYGHSWGGYAAAAILAKDHPITASVSISGYNTPPGVIYEYARRIMGPLGLIEFPFMWLDNLFRFGKEANVSAVSAINGSGTPVLIIHGTADTTIRFDGASIISRRGKITNPRAEYLIRSTEGQNSHNNLFLSPAAEDGTAELDEGFMDAVNTFYERSLRQRVPPLPSPRTP